MKNFFIILMFAFSCNCYANSNNPAHVIIIAGQSNTDGRVPNDRLPEYIKAMATDTTFTTGAYKYCKIAQNRIDGKFRPYWPKSKEGLNPTHGDMMLSPIIGWNSCGKNLSMLLNGLLVELPSSLLQIRINRLIGRQIPNGYHTTQQLVKKDVHYSFLLLTT